MGIDKKGGNVFERFKCMKCQGFGQARPVLHTKSIPVARPRDWPGCVKETGT